MPITKTERRYYPNGQLEWEGTLVDGRPDDNLENTGTLLARLPANLKKRKRALAWCNEQNEFQGFDPEDDEGQEWVVVQPD